MRILLGSTALIASKNGTPASTTVTAPGRCRLRQFADAAGFRSRDDGRAASERFEHDVGHPFPARRQQHGIGTGIPWPGRWLEAGQRDASLQSEANDLRVEAGAFAAIAEDGQVCVGGNIPHRLDQPVEAFLSRQAASRNEARSATRNALRFASGSSNLHLVDGVGQHMKAFRRHAVVIAELVRHPSGRAQDGVRTPVQSTVGHSGQFGIRRIGQTERRQIGLAYDDSRVTRQPAP